MKFLLAILYERQNDSPAAKGRQPPFSVASHRIQPADDQDASNDTSFMIISLDKVV